MEIRAWIIKIENKIRRLKKNTCKILVQFNIGKKFLKNVNCKHFSLYNPIKIKTYFN